MPEITRFFGIVISLFYDDHNPPHIHARYGKYKVTIDIKTHRFNGEFPPPGKKLILQWMKLNEAELLEMWKTGKAKRLKPLG